MTLETPSRAELRPIRLELSQSERDALNSAVQALQATASADNLFSLGVELSTIFPSRILEAFKLLKDGSHRVALIHISGLPPSKVEGFKKEGFSSELILAAVAHLLGRPFVATNHRDGSPFLNLIPRRVDKGKQLGTGTELEWHSEDAHLDHAARFICLLGLRGDPQAKTLVSLLNAATLTDDEWAKVLRSQKILIRSDDSYSETMVSGAPTLSHSPSDAYRIRFDPEFTLYPGPEVQCALDQFKKKLESTAYTVTVGAGDLLVFNNYLCAHKRSDFTPSYADTDRWVQRIMVS